MNVYSVFLDGQQRTIPNKAIEWVLKEDDWLRLLNGRMYFVATNGTSEKLYQRLKNVLHDEDQFFLVQIRTGDDSVGFLPGPAWDWLKKYFPAFTIEE